MRFAHTKGERSLSELVARLYRIEGPRAKSVARAAERALLEENPELRKLDEVPAGAVVAVPDVPGAVPTEEAGPLETAAADPLADELRRAFNGLTEALEEAVATEEQEAKRTIELVRSQDVKGVAKERPDVERLLPGITADAKTRLREAKALREHSRAAAAQLDKDLAEVLRLLE